MTLVKPRMENGVQIIDIPREFELPMENAIIRMQDGKLTITPISKAKEDFLGALQSFSDDFMEEGRPLNAQN